MATTIDQKLTTVQRLYHEIYNSGNRDASYIANCIVVGCRNKAIKLANLKKLLDSGCDIRTGNLWGTLRVNGEQRDFSTLD